MSKTSLAPDASGTGIFTIASPNSNTNRTLTLPDATGTVVISGTTPSLNGITFPATQVASADANTLDDYEEGTWTMTVTDLTNDYTMSNSTGFYTKIGRVVYISGQPTTSSIGSASGVIYITGLPFTSVDNIGARTSVSVGSTGGMSLGTAGFNIATQISNNENFIRLDFFNSTGGTSQLTTTQWPTGANRFITFGGFYFTT